MLFTGHKLLELLQRTETPIELRNEHGRCHRILSSNDALALDPNLFVGIGNKRRIRFLRPHTSRFSSNDASQTTKRLTNGPGVHIAHPMIREHRPLADAKISIARPGQN